MLIRYLKLIIYILIITLSCWYSFYAGVEKGKHANEVKQLKFKLSLYTYLYNAFNDENNNKHSENLRVLIFGVIQHYKSLDDDTVDKYDLNSKSFKKQINEAEDIVGDLELVDLKTGNKISSDRPLQNKDD